MAERFQIRTAALADVAALGVIERACFSDPWSDRSLSEALASPYGVGVVATGTGRVLGYLLAREVGGSGEILNLAVAPGARRGGVGSALLEEGLRLLGLRGAREVFLEVRASNLAATELYARSGFRAVGSRRGYYRAPTEDALVMRLEIVGSA